MKTYKSSVLYLSFILVGALASCGERRTAAPANQPEASPGELVTAAEFGAEWPFSVERGHVDCVPYQAAVFRTGGSVYALNGLARSRYPAIDPIWKANPDIPGTKISIGPMINRALARCD
ncbi:MAG: DUF2511 domain-containing protein [Acidobacteriota bacterium]